MKFYRCKVCGQVEIIDKNKDKELICCGRKMEQLKSRSIDATFEKHVPYCVVENNKIKVSIGKVLHSMTDEHYIVFIAQVIDNEINKIDLQPGDIPKVEFEYVKGSKIYAYCNLHGLWEENEL